MKQSYAQQAEAEMWNAIARGVERERACYGEAHDWRGGAVDYGPNETRIGFARKPSADVRRRLKIAGFRWDSRDRVWWHKGVVDTTNL